jgi:creatinine amidohydrolase
MMRLRSTELSALSWKEAEQAFKETDTAILPLGAVESHGPHNPLGTDWMAAWEVARRVGKASNALVAPVMPYGWSHGLMDFPGTISIGHDTLLQVLDDVLRCLHKWGIRRVVVLTGHGTNLPIMNRVAVRLREELGMLFAFPLWYRLAIALWPEWNLGPDHGGFTETCLAMVHDEKNVNLKEAQGGAVIADIGHGFDSQGKYEVTFKGAIVDIPLPGRVRWPLGYWDRSKPAVEASREKGEQILERVVPYLADFITHFRTLPLPAPRSTVGL